MKTSVGCDTGKLETHRGWLRHPYQSTKSHRPGYRPLIIPETRPYHWQGQSSKVMTFYIHDIRRGDQSTAKSTRKKKNQTEKQNHQRQGERRHRTDRMKRDATRQDGAKQDRTRKGKEKKEKEKYTGRTHYPILPYK